MTKNKTPQQPDKFSAIARELGCDESEIVFDQKLRQIAKARPSKKPDSQGK